MYNNIVGRVSLSLLPDMSFVFILSKYHISL